MGSSQSNTMKDITSVLQEQITNILNQNTSTSTVNCNVLQYNSFSTGCPSPPYSPGTSTNIYGNVTLSNKATQQCNLDAITNQSAKSISADQMANALNKAMAQAQSSIQGFLSTSSSAQSNKIYSSTDVTQRIVSNLSNENVAVCAEQSTLSQGNTVNICGNVYGNFDLSNVGTQVASAICLTTQIASAISCDSTLNSIIKDFDQSQKSKQEGIAGLFGLLFVAALIIGAIVVIMYFKNPVKASIGIGLLIAILIGLYFLFAYIFKFPPFHKYKNPQ